MQAIKWMDHFVPITGKKIGVITNLSFKFSNGTEDKVESYVATKSLKQVDAYSCSLTLTLNKFLGINVKKEANWWRDKCINCDFSELYLFGRQALKDKVMITSCEISKVQCTPDGIWTACDVKLTFTKTDGSKATDDDGSGGGGGGGGGGKKKRIKVSDGHGGWIYSTVENKVNGDHENSAYWSNVRTSSTASSFGSSIIPS